MFGITELLLEWNRGDEAALDRLMPLVYDDLRNVARRRLAAEDRDHTLQSAALVNETYLRLVDQRRVQWRDRTHFFAISARLMRRILVDHARHRDAGKRGGAQRTLHLGLCSDSIAQQGLDLVALDEALEALAALDAQQARAIELRFFGGLTSQEIADTLEISTATVTRDLVTAKAWLFDRLGRTADGRRDTDDDV